MPDASPMSHLRLTPQQLAAHMNKVNARPHNKFNAQKIQIDGFVFDSKKEYRRFLELKMLLVAGQITDLRVHPEYELVVNKVRIGKYTADYSYSQNGAVVVEDVKSKATKTEAYGLRKKLMLAVHGIEVVEA